MVASVVEYSLMAGAAYESTRGSKNRIPPPIGWSALNPEAGLDRRTNLGNGFEAAAFLNDKSGAKEIVISFAGTYFDDISGDWLQANVPLFSGVMSPQLRNAATYYKDIEKYIKSTLEN